MAREYSSRRSKRGAGVPHQVLIMVITFGLGYFTASLVDIETLSHWLTTQVLDNHPIPARKVPASTVQASKEHIPPKPKFEFYTLLANEKGAGANTSSMKHPASTPVHQNSVASIATNTPTATAPSTHQPTAPTHTATAAMPNGEVVDRLSQAAAQQTHSGSAQNGALKAIDTATRLTSNNNFVVQVAAFKARKDAEHLKGLLILKGFDVAIVPIAMPNQGNWFRVVIGPYPNRTLAQKVQSTLAKTERLKGMVRSA